MLGFGSFCYECEEFGYDFLKEVFANYFIFRRLFFQKKKTFIVIVIIFIKMRFPFITFHHDKVTTSHCSHTSWTLYVILYFGR